jgi:hypothetical protein
MSATPRTTFHIIRTESCVTENGDILGRSVSAERGNVERLRLPNPTRCDREEPGEHVRRGNQRDGVHGHGDEGGHEDDVDADAAAVRGAGRKRHLPRVATPVAEDGKTFFPCAIACGATASSAAKER